MPVSVIFPWFVQNDYIALRSFFSDGQRMPASFDAWSVQSTAALDVFQKLCVRVIQVPVGVPEFKVWCVEQRCLPDHRACHRFAKEVTLNVA